MVNIGGVFEFFFKEMRGFLVFFGLLFFFGQQFKMLYLEVSLFESLNKFGLWVVRVFRVEAFLLTLHSNLALQELPLGLTFLALLIDF